MIKTKVDLGAAQRIKEFFGSMIQCKQVNVKTNNSCKEKKSYGFLIRDSGDWSVGIPHKEFRFNVTMENYELDDHEKQALKEFLHDLFDYGFKTQVLTEDDEKAENDRIEQHIEDVSEGGGAI
jgi:hypothetical protein